MHLSVCVSVHGRMPTLLHRPGCNLGNGRGCPLVVHYWADLQIGAQVALLWQHSANLKYQRVLVVALCLVILLASAIVNKHITQSFA